MGQFKVPFGAACAAVFTILASALSGCAVAPPGGVANEAGANQLLLCEPGIIEAESAVVSSPTGIHLDRLSTDPGGLFQDIPEADMVSGMMGAASLALAHSGSPRASTGRVGTAYMIRLQCGGVTYAFEPGPQRFIAGTRVSVRHGATPGLLPR